MGLMGLLPVFIGFIIYLVIFGGILFLIYTWVNKFIYLRQEQNALLREIIKRMDTKANG